MTVTLEHPEIETDPATSPHNHNAVEIAVVIPCYKVSAHLRELVARIPAYVTTIYCVDDACPEGSGSLAEEIAADDVRVRVIHHPLNCGVGGAVMTGYQEAMGHGAKILVKLDGDGQMDPAYISQLVGPILRGEADYVKGNRFFNLEDVRVMPIVRLIGNTGLSFLSKLSTGYWNLFDPTNGFTALRVDVARLLPMHKLSKRYFFESDLLFRLNTIRAVVVDTPLPAQYGDEESNLNVGKALFEFPAKHFQNFLKRIFYNYILRDFNVASLNLIIGILLCGFGITFGSIRWIIGYETNSLASAGTVMLAALPIILGWQAILSFMAYDVSSIPRIPLHRKISVMRNPSRKS